MKENEELEIINSERNEKLISRPVKNLKTCPVCKGSGAIFNPIASIASICLTCWGKRYVSYKVEQSNISDFLKPLTDEQKMEILRAHNDLPT